MRITKRLLKRLGSTTSKNTKPPIDQPLQPDQIYFEEAVVLERPSEEFMKGLAEVGTSDDVIKKIASGNISG